MIRALSSTGQTITASNVPLLLPTTVVFDSFGNLYIAETNRHIVDRIDASGSLTVVAGNGTQGFSGDSGPATSAQLDSPQGLAIDAAGNLYIADAHNHRIRKVAANGIIATIAGNGSSGFSATQLNLPTALALDTAGNLYIADSNNHRIRQLTLATGVLQTVAGNGTQGDSGDGSLALNASIDSPSGLAVDSAQNLYIADTHNHRIRSVAHATGIITTTARATTTTMLPRGLSLDSAANLYVADSHAHRILRIATDGTLSTIAGEGTQGYSGDNGQATAALLDSPRSASVSPSGLVTFADTANQRVRAIGTDGIIRTFAGIGISPQTSLSLTSPSVVLYGTGSLAANLGSTTAASGTVSFYEVLDGLLRLLGSGTLAANAATFSTTKLAAGSHRILATYTGDASHTSAQSAVSALTVSPALVSVVPVSTTLLYGQAIPPLTGTLSGLLAQDAGLVTAAFTTTATSLSPVATYPINVALSGPSAANYQLANASGGALTIAQAPTTIAVTANAASATQGSAVTLSARVVSTTQGVPTGKISFLDAGTTLGSSALDASGTGILLTALNAGTHSLSAAYSGDGNFLASLSSSLSEVITTLPSSPVATTADFALSTSGSASQTASAGASATYSFAVLVQNGPLNSPILLSASGMPLGATATFSPTYLPPGNSVSTFTLTVQTATNARLASAPRSVFAAMLFFGGVLVPIGFRRRRIGRIECFLAILSVFLVGCGDRVTAIPSAKVNPTIYPMVVTATSTSSSGTTLQHTVSISLTVP